MCNNNANNQISYLIEICINISVKKINVFPMTAQIRSKKLGFSELCSLVVSGKPSATP